MKNTLFILFIHLFFTPLLFAQDLAENPFIRVDKDNNRIFTADPSAHVWADGRLYVYASHDVQPARGCDLMDKYHVFSTDDMIHWTDHGQILEAADVSWARPEGGFMWAPDCAFRNGMYFFYFPHKDADNIWRIGVATSTEPAANFTSQGYIEGMRSGIDPSVFVDDDGQAYIYQNSGGTGTCAVGKLKTNMVELDGEMQDMQGLVGYHEGPWVHKRNGIYYLSYADGHDDGYIKNEMRYAMSTSPMGPWTYKGVVVGGTTEGTQHGSIVQYKGQWYAFYHNNVLSFGTNPGGGARSICVDKLYYNEDGTMQKVIQTGMFKDPVVNAKNIPNLILAENYSTGIDGETYHDVDNTNNGGVYRHDGVDIEVCSEGKANIFNMEAGEWIGYKLNIPRTDNYKIDLRVSSPVGTGAFHVEVDGVNVSGRVTVNKTDDFQKWTTVALSNISLNSGTRLLKIVVDEAGFNLANFTVYYALTTPPFNKRIILKNGGKYVSFDQNNQVFCNSETMTSNCIFTVEQIGTGNKVELRTSNGKYIAAKSLKNSMTVESSHSANTRFFWYQKSYNNNEIGLKSEALNSIVCSENGTKAMNCNRYEIGAWETFVWQEYIEAAVEDVKADKVSLQVYPTRVQTDDKFTVEYNMETNFAITIQLIDAQGRVCKKMDGLKGGKQSLLVSTRGLATGSYFLQITASNFAAARKIILI